MANTGYSAYGYAPYYSVQDAHQPHHVRQSSQHDQHRSLPTTASPTAYDASASEAYYTTSESHHNAHFSAPAPAHGPAHYDTRSDGLYVDSPNLSPYPGEQALNPHGRHQSSPYGQEQGRQQGYTTYANEHGARPGSSSSENLAHASEHVQQTPMYSRPRSTTAQYAPSHPQSRSSTSPHDRPRSVGHQSVPLRDETRVSTQSHSHPPSMSPNRQLMRPGQAPPSSSSVPSTVHEHRPPPRPEHQRNGSRNHLHAFNAPHAADRNTLSNVPGESFGLYNPPTSTISNAQERCMEGSTLPLTVDPNQVFDQANYLRRMEMNDSKGIVGTEIARVPMPSATAAIPAPIINQSGSPSISTLQHDAQELRDLIAKIQKYKNEAPQMYTDTLELLKKEQQTPRAIHAALLEKANAHAAKPLQGLTIDQNQGAALQQQTPHPGTATVAVQSRQTPPNTAARRTQIAVPKTSNVGAAQPRPDMRPGPIAQVIPPIQSDKSVTGLIRGDTPRFTAKSAGNSRQTLWPEEKRQTLAEIASKILLTEPANAHLNIARAEIVAYLNENPTYDELCAKLFSRGFRFDKGSFARRLLAGLSPDAWSNLSHPEQQQEMSLKRKSDTDTVSEPAHKRQVVSADTAQGDKTKNASLSVFSYDGSASRSQKPASVPSIEPTRSSEISLPTAISDAVDGMNKIGSASPLQKATNRRSSQPKRGPATPVSAVPQRVTKEELARKTTFQEIIALSQLEESEEEAIEDTEIQNPQPKDLLSTPARSAGTLVHDSPPKPIASGIPKLPSATPPLHEPRPPNRPHHSNEHGRSKVQPHCDNLDWNKALRKSAYNPTTIARDFLIARGEHPYEPPLNHHLFPLMSLFAKISYKSDLSTFEWDVADPPLPEVNLTMGIKTVPSGTNGEATSSFAQASPLTTLRTEVGYKNLTSLHPSTAMQNGDSHKPLAGTPQIPVSMQVNSLAHLNTATRGSARGKPRGRPRGGRLRRDPVDSHADISARNEATKTAYTTYSNPATTPWPDLSGFRNPLTPSSGSRDAGGSALAAITPTSRSGPQFVDLTAAPAIPPLPQTSIPTASVAIERGIPSKHASGSSGHGASIGLDIQGGSVGPGTPASARAAAIAMTPEHTSAMSHSAPRARGRPRGRGIGATAFPHISQELGSDSSSTRGRGAPAGRGTRGRGRGRGRVMGRKVGRPPKEHPNAVNTSIPGDGIGVIIPSSPLDLSKRSVSYVEEAPASAKKSVVRKSETSIPGKPTDPDAYVPFKCQWIGCKAALHNLDTIRKHVFRTHRERCFDEQSKAYSCFWGDCDEFDSFTEAADWQVHVQTTHLDFLARELGDGPTVHPAARSYKYLCDAAGRQVIPIALTSGAPDPLPLYAGRGPTRAYHKAHSNITPEERARAERESLRYHAKRAAEARRGGLTVNKTAEWRESGEDSRSSSGSSAEDSQEDEDEDNDSEDDNENMQL